MLLAYLFRNQENKWFIKSLQKEYSWITCRFIDFSQWISELMIISNLRNNLLFHLERVFLEISKQQWPTHNAYKLDWHKVSTIPESTLCDFLGNISFVFFVGHGYFDPLHWIGATRDESWWKPTCLLFMVAIDRQRLCSHPNDAWPILVWINWVD